MLNRLCFVAPVVVWLAGFPTAQAQEGVLLRYSFSKDEPAIYRTSTDVSQTMFVGGQSFENKINQTEINTLTLEETTQERNLKLRHVNERLTLKADLGPAGTFNFDSESAEREKGTALANALNPVFEVLSGVEYSLTIAPSGKVQEIEGYQEVMEGLTKSNPLAAQFTGGGSEQALKDSLAEVFFIMDDQPVKPGATWEVPFELDLPKLGKAEGKRIYKFEGPITQDNPKLVRLSVTLDVDFTFDLDANGAAVTGSITADPAKSKGDIRFDTEKGQVVSANLEYSLDGRINVKTGSQELKTTIKQTHKRSTQQISALPK